MLAEPRSRLPTLNRTQVTVLVFFAAALGALVVVLALAPDVFDQALESPFADRLPFEVAFVTALSLFLVVLGIGVVRKWRWLFWMMLVAFLAGIVRLPESGLELSGILPRHGPSWYLVLQGAVGVVQFAIGIAMVRGLRRGGPWASF